MRKLFYGSCIECNKKDCRIAIKKGLCWTCYDKLRKRGDCKKKTIANLIKKGSLDPPYETDKKVIDSSDNFKINSIREIEKPIEENTKLFKEIVNKYRQVIKAQRLALLIAHGEVKGLLVQIDKANKIFIKKSKKEQL